MLRCSSKTPIILIPSERENSWRRKYFEELKTRITQGMRVSYLFSVRPTIRQVIRDYGNNKENIENLMSEWRSWLNYDSLKIRFIDSEPDPVGSFIVVGQTVILALKTVSTMQPTRSALISGRKYSSIFKMHFDDNWSDARVRKLNEGVILDIESRIFSRTNRARQVVDELIGNIKDNLRAIIRKTPMNEVEVQNAVETILKIKRYGYDREKVSIPWGSTYLKPDFTIDPIDTAMDIKLCRKADEETKITKEISEDIPAYRSKYGDIIFVVYDLGFIRDHDMFKRDFEKNNPEVHIVIVS